MYDQFTVRMRGIIFGDTHNSKCKQRKISQYSAEKDAKDANALEIKSNSSDHFLGRVNFLGQLN